MKLNDLIAALQDLAAEGHGELPVVIYEESCQAIRVGNVEHTEDVEVFSGYEDKFGAREFYINQPAITLEVEAL